MQEGIYEALATVELMARLSDLPPDVTAEFEPVDAADQPHTFARHVGKIVERVLRDVRDDEDRLALANGLLKQLTGDGILVAPGRHLTAVRAPIVPGQASRTGLRPSTPLSEAALLTNAKGEPNLGAELRAELDAADGVDLICAFVKWHGLRVIDQQLRGLRERNIPFRVITTTYMGATERKALDRLVREFGADVRIHYDEAMTRLHAKAWLFHRHTGYDTAYVGSSNLSRSALLDGVEWNVRLSRVGTPALLEKFGATFETYWNDPSFEPYDPDNVDHRDRLDDALARSSGRSGAGVGDSQISGLEVRPYPYQQHILDAVQAERELHGRHWNLVVAATGTGKTVIAALDYKRLSDSATNTYPSLLFVAHRKEILEQSRRTYCEVLADPNFGELYVDGARPERWRHVFASVQSLNSYGVSALPADAFDIVVVDEFHHAAAATYRGLLEHIRPRELLALTATPERSDGFDVRAYFGGRTAAELRLWEALQAGILSPFHYFMVSDGTDLSSVSWKRGRYDEAELEQVFTGNDARSRVVLKELSHKITDVQEMKALGFCVGVAHADYMAKVFNDAGISAQAVSGSTPPNERREALAALRAGEVKILFAADLFNEGVDIPDVNTLLFLRPTESATIFLQQLGRGLRSRPDKPVLTVLDFVGNQRREFRFDAKLGALTGRPRGRLKEDLEHGFPYLPAGSQVVLDERAQEVVLESLKTQISARWRYLVQQLSAMEPGTSLNGFLSDSGVLLPDVLRRGQRSWTELRADAGHADTLSPLEMKLARRVRALAHVDDPVRHTAYGALLQGQAGSYDNLSAVEKRLADMLFFSLWPDGGGFDSVGAGLESLAVSPAVRADTWEVIDLAFEAADHTVRPLSGRLAHVPLQVHARYQREEALAALGYASMSRKPNSFREGVLYEPDLNVDAFFVTLKKTDDGFSPTTMYRDYPISQELFHWESQSVTSVASKTGQRYVTGSSTVLIFVREEKKDEFGTSPYLFLGPATYVSHEGEKPIAITWRLDTPMPGEVFASASVAAG
ncbi:DUF3427 domain-containing protein [Ornithinimicrobium faecis]|uniref:DUF3427 domain-containing protein n=1 Tax=Ornithinimicrobium faecis TaxID=2934158 RepID=A0ABY4YWT0_9MICO|nr:DEAD/DEAH box helicase [Ornithinimicrobium sp. HY1793]USQ81238.1 DUF3427 domain-containing protein [Ornithinimicrobium sp. HY1793]